MEEELINAILSKMALKPLKGDAKKYFQRGHDLEKIYYNQLIVNSQNNEFPFGKIEQMSEVGLVQKIDKKHVKYSIDRMIGYIPEGESEPKLLLCEMKGRVASTTEQEECERVQRFHNSERFISTSSNSTDS